jgi:prolyl oligopeptidase PreP (S9A serine peptidase family)
MTMKTSVGMSVMVLRVRLVGESVRMDVIVEGAVTRGGERYPAVLLRAGNKDDLVPAWNGCKMAAVLQYATGGSVDKKVVSLRVLKDAGHGASSAKQKAQASLEKWL